MSDEFDKIILKSAARPVSLRRASPTVEQVLLACRHKRGLVALESLAGHEIQGRYSLVSFDPVRILRCDDTSPADPFRRLDEVIARYEVSPAECTVPLAGGWIGYLGYEAGRYLERLPCQAVRDLDLPLAWFGLFDTVAVFDHSLGQWFVAGVELPPAVAPARLSLGDRLGQMEALIIAAAAQGSPSIEWAGGAHSHLNAHRTNYIRSVERILDHILAGDIYQANLTTRFDIAMRGDSMELYRRLRRENPADYMAYLHCGDHQVLCSSPELFLRVAGDRVLTRPIKGTRSRAADPAVDRARKTELLASAKDLAELAMIVDVERNDLGRVCEQVSVNWPPAVETYATVHHLVADVQGRLCGPQPCVDGWAPRAETVVDLLRATFPGGSITGAPKIRAMEIIDRLEPVARGPYCGSIGFIGLDGRLTMNIAIRTMVVKDQCAHVHAGSGIVADSDPESEYEETLAKAKGMFSALGIEQS